MILDTICKFPKMNLERVRAKLDKAEVKYKVGELKTIHASAHAVIDKLKEHGKLA